MRTLLERVVNIHTASAKPFLIAKAGKPVARVASLNKPHVGQVQRLAARIVVPVSLDGMGCIELERLLEGSGELALCSSNAF